MDHVAIMNKRWKLIPRILSGEKSIESRWYMSKRAPWDRVHAGDVVYFKDAGGSVTAKAEVAKVLQFDNFTTKERDTIFHSYGDNIFTDPKASLAWVKGKKYCVLIFLKNPVAIKPFEIDKTGYGNACAWLCVDNIKNITL